MLQSSDPSTGSKQLVLINTDTDTKRKNHKGVVGDEAGCLVVVYHSLTCLVYLPVYVSHFSCFFFFDTPYQMDHRV